MILCRGNCSCVFSAIPKRLSKYFACSHIEPAALRHTEMSAHSDMLMLQIRWFMRRPKTTGIWVMAFALGLTGCGQTRSEEHTSELQSLMRISYAGLFLKK